MKAVQWARNLASLIAFRAPFQKRWHFKVQTAGRREVFPQAIREVS